MSSSDATSHSPERRIDITLARLAGIHEAMSDDERSQLDGKQWWAVIVIISRLRAMERAEEEVLGRPIKGLADTYDAVVSPGEHAVEALLRTFQTAFSSQEV